MKNWKTTLAGVIGGVLTMIAGGMNWKTAIAATAIGAVGTLAKDHDGTAAPAQ